MSEEKSIADRLMDRIKKQTIINTIKSVFKKYPQARVILPFLKDGIETAKSEVEKYLGDADNIIIIGRKQGVTNIVVVNGKKNFTLTTGLKLTATDKDAIVSITSINKYLDEINDFGLFELITEEDNKKFKEMKDGGFDQFQDMISDPAKALAAGESVPSENTANEEATEIGQEETIAAPDSIKNPAS